MIIIVVTVSNSILCQKSLHPEIFVNSEIFNVGIILILSVPEEANFSEKLDSKYSRRHLASK